MALAWSYSGNGMARLSQIDLQRQYLQDVWIGYTNGDSDTTEGRAARPWPNRGFVEWELKPPPGRFRARGRAASSALRARLRATQKLGQEDGTVSRPRFGGGDGRGGKTGGM